MQCTVIFMFVRVRLILGLIVHMRSSLSLPSCASMRLLTYIGSKALSTTCQTLITTSSIPQSIILISYNSYSEMIKCDHHKAAIGIFSQVLFENAMPS